jgi:hypothetical protein
MTIAVEIIDGLRELGVEIIPNYPTIRLRYPKGPQPPDEARPLIEALRSCKAEVLDALTHWDEGRESERLNAAFDWADAESGRRRIAWDRAWEARPVELGGSIDQAFDAINEAWGHRDPTAHAAALEHFRLTIAAILDAYQTRTPGERIPA